MYQMVGTLNNLLFILFFLIKNRTFSFPKYEEGAHSGAILLCGAMGGTSERKRCLHYSTTTKEVSCQQQTFANRPYNLICSFTVWENQEYWPHLQVAKSPWLQSANQIHLEGKVRLFQRRMLIFKTWPINGFKCFAFASVVHPWSELHFSHYRWIETRCVIVISSKSFKTKICMIQCLCQNRSPHLTQWGEAAVWPFHPSGLDA